MTLTAKDVAEITRLLESSAFDELLLESEGLKLTLRRQGAPVEGAAPPGPAPSGTAAASAPSAAPAPAAPPAVARAAPVAGAQFVTAPMLGTFYRAPKPGAPPYVEVGTVVEADSIVGIVEVMKLMNAVRAGRRGTVLEILGRDGALVEFGEALLRLAPAD
jgi:acetyl-CoA carboxylase biotin carboxyl carrier protein